MRPLRLSADSTTASTPPVSAMPHTGSCQSKPRGGVGRRSRHVGAGGTEQQLAAAAARPATSNRLAGCLPRLLKPGEVFHGPWGPQGGRGTRGGRGGGPAGTQGARECLERVQRGLKNVAARAAREMGQPTPASARHARHMEGSSPTPPCIAASTPLAWHTLLRRPDRPSSIGLETPHQQRSIPCPRARLNRQVTPAVWVSRAACPALPGSTPAPASLAQRCSRACRRWARPHAQLLTRPTAQAGRRGHARARVTSHRPLRFRPPAARRAAGLAGADEHRGRLARPAHRSGRQQQQQQLAGVAT